MSKQPFSRNNVFVFGIFHADDSEGTIDATISGVKVNIDLLFYFIMFFECGKGLLMYPLIEDLIEVLISFLLGWVNLCTGNRQDLWSRRISNKDKTFCSKNKNL